MPAGDRIKTGATISLSGGMTTDPLANAVAQTTWRCWCRCNVDWPSAHNWPMRGSSWWGKHDCNASIPRNPSDPILAMTSVISHCNPKNATDIHSSAWSINRDESSDTNPGAGTGHTHPLKYQRRKNGHLTSCINHEFHFGPLCPHSQKPGGSCANTTHYNSL